MAVEAHHPHLFPSQQQLMIRSRETINTIENQASSFYNTTQMASAAPPSAFAGNFIPFFYNPYNLISADASESGLTCNDLSTAAADAASSQQRKRHRPICFLGEDISSHIQQQQLELDRLVANYNEKVRLELWERRSRFSRRIAAAAEDGMLKWMKAKEEEIEKIGKLNRSLEERIKSLCVENQIWRDLAQSNKAAANLLRTNLEHVLAQARVREEQQQRGGGGGGCETLEDAESCCCDNNHDGDGDGRDETTWRETSKRLCKRCGVNEPSVLLLPCRHLCLCVACGPAANVCPICKCDKNGSVNINLS